MAAVAVGSKVTYGKRTYVVDLNAVKYGRKSTNKTKAECWNGLFAEMNEVLYIVNLAGEDLNALQLARNIQPTFTREAAKQYDFRADKNKGTPQYTFTVIHGTDSAQVDKLADERDRLFRQAVRLVAEIETVSKIPIPEPAAAATLAADIAQLGVIAVDPPQIDAVVDTGAAAAGAAGGASALVVAGAVKEEEKIEEISTTPAVSTLTVVPQAGTVNGNEIYKGLCNDMCKAMGTSRMKAAGFEGIIAINKLVAFEDGVAGRLALADYKETAGSKTKLDMVIEAMAGLSAFEFQIRTALACEPKNAAGKLQDFLALPNVSDKAEIQKIYELESFQHDIITALGGCAVAEAADKIRELQGSDKTSADALPALFRGGATLRDNILDMDHHMKQLQTDVDNLTRENEAFKASETLVMKALKNGQQDCAKEDILNEIENLQVIKKIVNDTLPGEFHTNDTYLVCLTAWETSWTEMKAFAVHVKTHVLPGLVQSRVSECKIEFDKWMGHVTEINKMMGDKKTISDSEAAIRLMLTDIETLKAKIAQSAADTSAKAAAIDASVVDQLRAALAQKLLVDGQLTAKESELALSQKLCIDRNNALDALTQKMIASEQDNRRILQLKVDLQAQLHLSDQTKYALEKQLDALTALPPATPNAPSTSSGSTRPAQLNDRVTGLLGQLQTLLLTDFKSDARYDYDNMIERIHKLIETAFPDVDRDRAVKDLTLKFLCGMYKGISTRDAEQIFHNLNFDMDDMIHQYQTGSMTARSHNGEGGRSAHRQITHARSESTAVRIEKPAGSTPAGAERSSTKDVKHLLNDLSELQTSPPPAVESGGRAPPSSTVTPGSGGAPGGEVAEKDKSAGQTPVNPAPVGEAAGMTPRKSSESIQKAKPAAVEADKAAVKSGSYFSLPTIPGFHRTPKPAEPAKTPPSNAKPAAGAGGV